MAHQFATTAPQMYERKRFIRPLRQAIVATTSELHVRILRHRRRHDPYSGLHPPPHRPLGSLRPCLNRQPAVISMFRRSTIFVCRTHSWIRAYCAK